MIIKSRIREKGINALMILFLFFGTGIYSCTVQAQSLSPVKYMGFEVSFGVRSFAINSNIAAINKMAVVEEGASLGVIFGNDYLKAKVRAAGFYYSASKVPHTVDLFESEGLLNFYPMKYLLKRKLPLDVYLLGGIGMDNLKFYGNYLTEDPGKINYSTTKEPYLGKLSQINASVGVGFEYQLPMANDFVHLFAEAKYGKPVRSASNNDSFEGTSVINFTSISAGVSFGLQK